MYKIVTCYLNVLCNENFEFVNFRFYCVSFHDVFYCLFDFTLDIYKKIIDS